MNLILGNKLELPSFSGLEGISICPYFEGADKFNWIRSDDSDVSSIGKVCLRLSDISATYDTLFILPSKSFSFKNLESPFDFLDLNSEFASKFSYLSVLASVLLKTFQIKQTIFCTSPKLNSFWHKIQRQIISEYLKDGGQQLEVEIFD